MIEPPNHASKSWVLSPSDFGFLWDECRRCFYRKVVLGRLRPKAPFPKIFGDIDEHMKRFYEGKRTDAMGTGMPDGVVHVSDQWVVSRPITRPGRAGTCVIRGKFDTVLRCDDGSYAVIDYKTTSPSSKTIEKYFCQLHAYAYALEHPAAGALELAPVRHLGILAFKPDTFAQGKTGRVGFAGHVTWHPVHRDDTRFLEFLDEVLGVLEAPSAPPSSSTCQWCSYQSLTEG